MNSNNNNQPIEHSDEDEGYKLYRTLWELQSTNPEFF